MIKTLSQSVSVFVISVFVSIFSCDDRSNDVLKNVYARGYGAQSVVLSEYIAVCVFGVMSCLVNWTGAFISGLMSSRVAGGSAYVIALMGVQLLLILAYVSLFFMISKLIPKPAAVVALNILAPIALTMIFTLFDGMSAQHGVVMSLYSIDGLLKSVSSVAAPGATAGLAAGLALVYLGLFALVAMLVGRRRPA